MRGRRIASACLRLPGAVKEFPFGEEVSVFKVAGKVFAVGRLDADPPTISLRCEPELALRLRAEHAAIEPGYHLNKRHWNTITVDGSLPDAMVIELIEDSYDLVVESLTRAARARLEER